MCLVSPDPIGPADERAVAWAEFVAFADQHGWSIAVVAAQPAWLPIYEPGGMRSVYMGDEAIVDCQSFTPDGGPMKSVRGAYNRVLKAGYTVEFLDPSRLDDATVAELREVMTQTRQGDAERGFSMTLSRIFDPEDRGLLLAVARNSGRRVDAFCHFAPAAAIDGWSLDLKRRRADADLPNGLTDFVVIETIKHIREAHRWGLGLNFAVMRAVMAGEREGGLYGLERRVLHRFGETMQIESLWRYNEKFRALLATPLRDAQRRRTRRRARRRYCRRRSDLGATGDRPVPRPQNMSSARRSLAVPPFRRFEPRAR